MGPGRVYVIQTETLLIMAYICTWHNTKNETKRVEIKHRSENWIIELLKRCLKVSKWDCEVGLPLYNGKANFTIVKRGNVLKKCFIREIKSAVPVLTIKAKSNLFLKGGKFVSYVVWSVNGLMKCDFDELCRRGWKSDEILVREEVGKFFWRKEDQR